MRALCSVDIQKHYIKSYSHLSHPPKSSRTDHFGPIRSMRPCSPSSSSHGCRPPSSCRSSRHAPSSSSLHLRPFTRQPGKFSAQQSTAFFLELVAPRPPSPDTPLNAPPRYSSFSSFYFAAETWSYSSLRTASSGGNHRQRRPPARHHFAAARHVRQARRLHTTRNWPSAASSETFAPHSHLALALLRDHGGRAAPSQPRRDPSPARSEGPAERSLPLRLSRLRQELPHGPLLRQHAQQVRAFETEGALPRLYDGRA